MFAEFKESQTSTEVEEQVVIEASKVRSAPLSEVLFQLVEGISDDILGKEFFEKIKKVEKEKYSGEYLDHWSNGQLKIKAFFKEGKVDGHVHGWFEDGEEAFKAFFYENTKAGIHIAFYLKENPTWYQARYARILSYNFDGQLDGQQVSDYFQRGLKTIAYYRDGVLEGGRESYSSGRKCVRKEAYKKGKLVENKLAAEKSR